MQKMREFGERIQGISFRRSRQVDTIQDTKEAKITRLRSVIESNNCQVDSLDIERADDLTMYMVSLSGLAPLDDYTLALVAAQSYAAISTPSAREVHVAGEFIDASAAFSFNDLVTLKVEPTGTEPVPKVQVSKKEENGVMRFTFYESSSNRNLYPEKEWMDRTEKWTLGEDQIPVTVSQVNLDVQGRPVYLEATRPGIYQADEEQFRRDCGGRLTKTINDVDETAAIHEVAGLKNPGDKLTAKGEKALKDWCADVSPKADSDALLAQVMSTCSQGFLADGASLCRMALDPDDPIGTQYMAIGESVTPEYRLEDRNGALQITAQFTYKLYDPEAEELGIAIATTTADLGTGSMKTTIQFSYQD